MTVTSLSSDDHFTIVDKHNYQRVFDQLFSPLCSFAYRYLGEITSAEDMVQESFIALWEQRTSFNHINAIKSFLYTSTRNKCLNYLKHQRVIQKHEESLIYELESTQFFSHHVIEEESFNRLYQEIDMLPDAAKKIMLLAIKGLKNREIAEELNISENTVKTQKKIAYAKLKANLSPAILGMLLAL